MKGYSHSQDMLADSGGNTAILQISQSFLSGTKIEIPPVVTVLHCLMILLQ